MTEIEGYADLEAIGRGGFAIVYKARQESVGRDVAIKLLTDPAPDDDLVRRFRRESKAVGALSWHPNIAAVVDAGTTTQGQAFIVFELLSGGSLEERIEQGPMPWPDAVASMIQVADAVEAAHRSDVLHRDIKPANILLDRLGRAKLGDFGIASMQDGSKTETGMLATTVAHAAPELFNGELASPATDVYALGSTLHNLVTGHPPFAQNPQERIAAVIGRIMSDPPPRPDPATVPEAVAQVIAHALAKQPQYRPRTAAAFGQALQDAQRQLGQPVTAMPATDSNHGAPSAGTIAQAPTNPVATPSSSPSRAAPPAAPPSAIAPVIRPVTEAAPATLPPAQFSPTSPSIAHAPAAKPFGRTIAALASIAAILALAVAGLFLYQSTLSNKPVATTIGGAPVASFEALPSTEMPPPFDAAAAVDNNESTYWGIAPGEDGTLIRGTTFVIKLTEPKLVRRVGISNGTGGEFGRISNLQWANTIAELEQRATSVRPQEIPDELGTFTIAYDQTTDQVVLVIAGLHDPLIESAGVAEIVIETE